MLLWQTFILGISTLARKIEITLKVMHLTRKETPLFSLYFPFILLYVPTQNGEPLQDSLQRC